MDYWQFIAERVFTEAGLVAFLLFVWGLYLVIQLHLKDKKINELHDRIHSMGMEQIRLSVESNQVLDKIADTVHTLLKGSTP